MAEASVISEEMKAAIGVESPPTTVEVDKTACRMFARAVGHTDLIFYDEEYAKSKGYRSIVAPPHYLGTPVYRPDQPQQRGPAATGFQIPFKRVLNGGTDIEYFDTICAGDVLTVTTKLTDIYERAGSMGPMLFMIRESTYRNQEGKIVAKSRGTSIHY